MGSEFMYSIYGKDSPLLDNVWFKCERENLDVDPVEENKEIFGLYFGIRRFSFMGKVLVDVLVQFTTEGGKVPLGIQWEDGRMTSIDRVIDVRKAASIKAGAKGLRYTCRVKGKQMYLFSEGDKWYLETTQ